MADITKTTARHIDHMTYTQAPAVHEKNIFHLLIFVSLSQWKITLSAFTILLLWKRHLNLIGHFGCVFLDMYSRCPNKGGKVINYDLKSLLTFFFSLILCRVEIYKEWQLITDWTHRCAIATADIIPVCSLLITAWLIFTFGGCSLMSDLLFSGSLHSKHCHCGLQGL